MAHGSPKRIAALDGWRGIAILLVIADHFNAYAGEPFPALDWLGQHGVTIFFVLSGYLITTKLRQSSDLKSFYVRRFWRLMPAAWVYLAVVFSLRLIDTRELTSCVLFFRNFEPNRVYFASHFWTLSLEEQFYLVWPGLFLLSKRRAPWVALGLAGCVALWRFTHLGLITSLPPSALAQTQYRADGLFIGCALAFVPATFRIPRPWLVFSLSLASLVLDTFAYKIPIPAVESLTVALLLWMTANNVVPFATRLLDNPYLSLLGRMSYSVYLWQMLAAHLPSLALKIFATAMLATASYYLIEKPMIRIPGLIAKRSLRVVPDAI